MIQYLVILGALVNFLGSLAYLIKTIKGKTKPNRVSWLLWTVAPMIAAVAAFSNGVRWAVLPVFMSGFTPLMILAASFVNKKSYWKLEKFDYGCGLFSVLALIIWAVTKDPVIAIIFSILSDGFAAIPTVIKAWKFPDTESASIYAVGVFSALTSFAAVKTWTFSEYGFAIYLVISNLSIIFSIYHEKILKRN